MAWANFTREEFACKCGCGTNEIKDELIDEVQQIRTLVGHSLVITSGYRCPKHPAEVRKAITGTHALGVAADIKCSHGDAYKVLNAAFKSDTIKGIGVKQAGIGRFIHVDIAPKKDGRPRPTVWSY